MNKEKDDMTITRGSDNVFADLGVENPEEYLIKARLASLIYDHIEEKGWTQRYAAGVLGIKQPDVSNICRGLLDHFSVERLMNFLVRLNNRVVITIQNEEQKSPLYEIVVANTVPKQKVQSML